MNQRIAHITLLVRDYDEAIEFYTQKLNFKLVEDTPLSPEKRWVRVAPRSSGNFSLLLAKADGETQKSHIGNQTGGRVFLFLYTDDFWRDYRLLIDNQVKINRIPKEESYGIVAVFEDIYGNLWDLLQPSN